MEYCICHYKTGGWTFIAGKPDQLNDYEYIWVFDALDFEDASLKFHRFTWIYDHHKSETEAVKVLYGEENTTLLPDYNWIESAVKNNNTFGALLALRTIKQISIREAQDEVHEIWKRLSEQL